MLVEVMNYEMLCFSRKFFVYKQKTGKEDEVGLVGSGKGIRDREKVNYILSPQKERVRKQNRMIA